MFGCLARVEAWVLRGLATGRSLFKHFQAKRQLSKRVPGDRYEVCGLLLSMLDHRKSRTLQPAPETARALASVDLSIQKKLTVLQASMKDQADDFRK